ncbi:MAG: AmmeMemoRadiSam system protein A [Gammaproteobacteria bacterium]|nr:AmmeMemoRadiSam system protein A [Gammaproteobacteria bacterium]
MSSTEPNYTAAEKHTLLRVARDSIFQGLTNGRALDIDARNYSPALRKLRASFVTLELDNNLRGCIGTLEAKRAVVEDVAHNAFAAAFDDPRFAPLTAEEFARLALHISVLSPPELMTVDSEQDLQRQLRAGIDGLILDDGRHRGTFLPSVWESLPEPRDFIRRLKLKAGLPETTWSKSIKVLRYTTESIS